MQMNESKRDAVAAFINSGVSIRLTAKKLNLPTRQVAKMAKSLIEHRSRARRNHAAGEVIADAEIIRMTAIKHGRDAYLMRCKCCGHEFEVTGGVARLAQLHGQRACSRCANKSKRDLFDVGVDVGGCEILAVQHVDSTARLSRYLVRFTCCGITKVLTGTQIAMRVYGNHQQCSACNSESKRDAVKWKLADACEKTGMAVSENAKCNDAAFLSMKW